MPRIGKNDAKTTLERVGQNIIDAAGKDGVTSRKDLKKALTTLSSPTEKALTDRFFRFIDHRDYKTGARITEDDVARAVAYASEHLLASYDENHNGYSKLEAGKMSMTGQLTLRLTAELKGIKPFEPALPTSDLGKAITKAAENTYFSSEGDSQPEFISAPFAKNKPVTGDAVMKAFQGHLLKAFDEQDRDLKEYTFEAMSKTENAEFLSGLADPTGADSDYDRDNAAGFGRIKAVFDAHITDVKVFRVGLRDEDRPNELGVDDGAYRYLIVGRTADGKLAGISYESVET